MTTPVVDLLMAHVRTVHPLVYIGPSAAGINRRPFPLHIFQSFVDAHPDRFPRDGSRRPDGTMPPAGQRNKFYKSFRDHWLKLALQRIRAEDMGVPVDHIPETEYDLKFVKNEQGQIVNVQTRSIKEWADLTEDNAMHATMHVATPVPPLLTAFYAAELEAMPVDTACATPLAVDETELWPPYVDTACSGVDTLCLTAYYAAELEAMHVDTACADGPPLVEDVEEFEPDLGLVEPLELGQVVTKKRRRAASGRCSNTQCTLGARHDGLCSHMQVCGRRRRLE